MQLVCELPGHLAVERGAPGVEVGRGTAQALVAERGDILAGDVKDALTLCRAGLEQPEHVLEHGDDCHAVAGGEPPHVTLPFGLLCWIRRHDQVIARPGRGGHMPPRSSMARATRASGERNPKAMRVRSRSFVFTLSTRAFDSPWLSAASMPARWSRVERASLTNAGSRQRQAHFSQASSSAIPSAPLS